MQSIENSIWRYLVNGVFHVLFSDEYCASNHISVDWQWIHPQLCFSYIETIEKKYCPVEFIITRNGVREGYRYTYCYMNEDRLRKLFDSKNLDRLYVIDFSSASQSSFFKPLMIPKEFDGSIRPILLKDFFLWFLY